MEDEEEGGSQVPSSGGVDRLPPPVAFSSSSSARMEEEKDEGVLHLAANPGGSTLPEDVLADILRRLPPRGLAVSRCVCTAWRDAVDGRRLLRADLLPRSVRGLLLRHRDLDYPAFLSRPSAASGPDDDDDIHILAGATPHPHPDLPSYVELLDHCNGLVLFRDPRGLLVCNPATRRWAHLPPLPRRAGSGRLVFDPADSLHYNVLIVPESRCTENLYKHPDQATRDMLPLQEWPPSTWILSVFSSLTGKWEERSFAREGEPSEMASEEGPFLMDGYGVYCRGALYEQCYTGTTSSVLRISLSNHKYRVIKAPTEYTMNSDYLGRSENRVCFGTTQDWYIVQIWILDESRGLMQWVLKHHIDLKGTVVSRIPTNARRFKGPWMLRDFNFEEELHYVNNDEGGNSSKLTELKFEWDSDNDDVPDHESEVCVGLVTFLGFHPFKQIVFLSINLQKIVAFHLITSKVHVLGKACPNNYGGPVADILACLPYTPCLMAELPGYEFEAPAED